jgi:AraC-like DNA-binding protein
MQSVRTRREIDNSAEHFLYAVYALSGLDGASPARASSIASIEQNGRAHLVREGDLCIVSLRIVSAPPEELNRLFQAALHLLPLAISSGDGRAQRTLPRSFACFIEDNLANSALSAEYTARHLQCSVRYVHKVFSSIGTTFGLYVSNRRLDHARGDLVSAGRSSAISAIAYKWGYNDLSTFNRAFKRKFGCTPTAVRG